MLSEIRHIDPSKFYELLVRLNTAAIRDGFAIPKMRKQSAKDQFIVFVHLVAIFCIIFPRFAAAESILWPFPCSNTIGNICVEGSVVYTIIISGFVWLGKTLLENMFGAKIDQLRRTEQTQGGRFAIGLYEQAPKLIFLLGFLILLFIALYISAA